MANEDGTKAEKAEAGKAQPPAAADAPAEVEAPLEAAPSPIPVTSQAATVSTAEPTAGLPDPTAVQVVAERGKVLLKLAATGANFGLSGFNLTLNDGDEDPENWIPVTVTATGVQVTKQQAEEIQASARAHGIELTEESA